MEEHRLKPMQSGYDEKLFNKIYKETSSLRKKLAYGIDSRRFGVDYQEVLSWFDVKFIYAFNKYYGDKDDAVLKGFVISSLQMFKNRILRMSYSKKAGLNNTVDIMDSAQMEMFYEDEDTEDLFLKVATDFFKAELSRDAYFLFELTINPPSYILNQLSQAEKFDINKIPNNLIMEYLDLEDDKIHYIDNLRKEVRKITRKAKEHFMTRQLSFQ